MPQQGSGSTDEDGFAEGNADELFRIRDQITAASPELVVVLSSDHVYRFDYTEAIHTHRDIRAGAEIADSMVSPGCDVQGVVRRSVLGPGVVVEKGARVEDSVVFADALIKAGAAVSWSIVDVCTEIGVDAKVGGEPARQPPAADQITLVGRDSEVRSSVAPGARLEPGTTI